VEFYVDVETDMSICSKLPSDLPYSAKQEKNLRIEFLNLGRVNKLTVLRGVELDLCSWFITVEALDGRCFVEFDE
jgi:hypothetical protein